MAADFTRRVASRRFTRVFPQVIVFRSPSSQCGLRFSTLAKSRCNKVSRRSPLFQVTEEIILRELADGGECGLGVDLGSGEIGGGCSEIRAAKRVLLMGDLKLGGIEVSGLRLRLVRGIAIEDALRRYVTFCR